MNYFHFDNNKIFDGMVAFCAIVEEGSFTAAAQKLHHTTSHVSKQIARLELRLGTRLMNRTTRKISLTETGQIFYQNSKQIIDNARLTYSQILSAQDKPLGHLKISTPVMFGEACLNRWMPEFAYKFPDVTLDVEISDRIVDIISEGFDIIVRAGNLQDTEFVARKLMQTRLVTVVSPAYLKRQGTPQTPSELADHSLISFTMQPNQNSWKYLDHRKSPFAVTIAPKIRCNSASMEVALAKSGFGITRVPHLACETELGEGSLVTILDDFEIEKLSLHAIYPSRQHLAPKVRAFVDFLVEKCSGKA